MTHERKILPEFLDAVKRGEKTFEVRKEEPGEPPFQPGDGLWLRGWTYTLDYTGDEWRGTIGYVLRGEQWGIMPGYAVLGLREE
jgi:hypothetical protein